MKKKYLLIIILLIIILTIIAVPIYLNYIQSGHPIRPDQMFAILATAIEDFKTDTGRYPTQDEGLKVLLKNPRIKHWDSPYLNGSKIPLDPWGSEYVYKKTKNGFIIKSLGPDRKADTADDIIHELIISEI